MDRTLCRPPDAARADRPGSTPRFGEVGARLRPSVQCLGRSGDRQGRSDSSPRSVRRAVCDQGSKPNSAHPPNGRIGRSWPTDPPERATRSGQLSRAANPLGGPPHGRDVCGPGAASSGKPMLGPRASLRITDRAASLSQTRRAFLPPARPSFSGRYSRPAAMRPGVE